MRHSIGDVSRLLGMTTSALHYYEKEGVIDTPKVESGRRYYEEADVYRLVSAKKYRAMGVTLKEIAEQFGPYGMGAEQVLTRMEEKREEAMRLAEQYTKLAGDIDRLIRAGREGVRATGKVDFFHAEDMLMLCTESGSIVPEDKEQQCVVQRLLEAMPAVGIGVYREAGKEAGHLGYIIPAARAMDFGIKADGRLIRRVQGGLALRTVVRCGAELYAQPSCIFAALDAYAREHRFTPKGSYGVTLFVDCAEGELVYYFAACMVIE